MKRLLYIQLGILAWTMILLPAAMGLDVVRRELETGVYAVLRDARNMGVEFRVQPTGKGRETLRKYLLIEDDWTVLGESSGVFISLEHLKPESRREVLLRIFEDDFVDGKGWHHTTREDGESVWSASAWITGDGRNSDVVLAHPENGEVPMLMRAGQRVLFPLTLLDETMRRPTGQRAALPRTTPKDLVIDHLLLEPELPYRNRERSHALTGVVVILDPGHGGAFVGARHASEGLLEDEINYDVVCRILELLNRGTSARVYLTSMDESSGLKPTDARRFSHDQDEVLLTTPRHLNSDSSSVSVNLRWMLVNAIYEREINRGVYKKNVIFTSIHTEAMPNSSMRGTIVYVPGARLRRSEEACFDNLYAEYDVGRSHYRFTSTHAERNRDEALSRQFAETLIDQLGAIGVHVHDMGDPIRSQIRQGPTQVFLPAVLRNTMVPTKVLIEMANLTNEADRQLLASPVWRQKFAAAYVDALKRHFGAGSLASRE